MRKPFTLGIVAIGCLIGLVATDRIALGQAGSTGGTIGKTDKSVSGGENSGPPPSSPQPKPRHHPLARAHDVAITLAGRWSCNDGGTYTIKQSGLKVSWEGVSGDGGKTWTHTFNGVIQDNIVDGTFFDHPPGSSRYSGSLKIKIVDANRLEKIEGIFFGGSAWARGTPPR